MDEDEVARRRDCRLWTICTIDPETARFEGHHSFRSHILTKFSSLSDLDDALSCKPLPNGNFEVGVHIADVSFVNVRTW